MLLTKMDARNSQNMAFITTKVKGAGESVPTEYRMLQNYPNPFNPSTTIQYELPATGEVTVEVYNMLGERIVTLVNEAKEAGYHQVEWNGRDGNQRTVASGVYFYRIHAGSFSNVMRMLLLK
jgi:flagellar hook assembly protein FlgD